MENSLNNPTITILGSCGTCPSADGACSSYLLQTGESRILIDAGNGAMGKLQKHCGLNQLDAVVISHLHFDHFADLLPLKYALETLAAAGERNPEARLPLYLPKMPEWLREELGENVFEFHEISGSSEIRLLGMHLRFVEVKHLIPSYAMRFEWPDGKVFAYSSDSGECPGLVLCARNADLFLCESTFLEPLRCGITHHLSAEQAAAAALKANAKSLLLTHLWMGHDPAEYEEEARRIFPSSAVALSGKIYQI